MEERKKSFSLHQQDQQQRQVGGMRQRYRELLEMQQKAETIFEEYLIDKSYLDYRKVYLSDMVYEVYVFPCTHFLSNRRNEERVYPLLII